MFSPEFMDAIRDEAFEYIDRLYADAGVTDGMTSAETDKRISAEYWRREKLAAEREAQVDFWRAVQRRREQP